MRRLVILGCAAMLVAACGSKSPTTPTTPANPNVVTFTAALSAANENPPITGAEAGGRGTATITLNLTRDAANAITGATGTFVYSLSGLPNGTPVILTHIHLGGPTINGGVQMNSGLSAASPIILASGTLTNQTFSNLQFNNNNFALAQQIIDNPNGFYFNVHTTANPGGVVRGQLVRQ